MIISSCNFKKNKVLNQNNDEAYITAPNDIKICLLIDNYIILLLNEGKPENSANICCYKDSELLWIIAEAININHSSFYTSVYFREDLFLYAYSINGVEYKIDYKTGQILTAEFIK